MQLLIASIVDSVRVGGGGGEGVHRTQHAPSTFEDIVSMRVCMCVCYCVCVYVLMWVRVCVHVYVYTYSQFGFS